jgi:nitroimidazol reductase NimA-like FMN-containing flavoprotein (pyridoxamine 5'-phosphate oxidase superfamily)
MKLALYRTNYFNDSCNQQVAFTNPLDSMQTPLPTTADSYAISERNRIKRMHERGHYDHATVHALLDSAMLCHVAYVINGEPYCTPTLYWREGSRLYWHGSSASRMLRQQSEGQRACLTVTQLDSLVLARSGFNHSIDYRSVMAFGQAFIVTDPEEKERALRMMVDRLYPDRTAGLRQTTALEIKATAVIAMDIEEASAKVRNKGVGDDEEDYALPIYAERLPIQMVIGTPEPCPRLVPGVRRPEALAAYAPGRLLEEALRDAYAQSYPETQAG